MLFWFGSKINDDIAIEQDNHQDGQTPGQQAGYDPFFEYSCLWTMQVTCQPYELENGGSCSRICPFFLYSYSCSALESRSQKNQDRKESCIVGNQ